nr:Uncharacterised protein [Klebsiella pneumoniae]
MEPKSSQLPIKPRLRSGEYSATKIDAPVYSPPTEKPCAILHSSSRIGAQIPIVAYDGIRPIQKVLIDMITIVIARIFADHIYRPASRRTGRLTDELKWYGEGTQRGNHLHAWVGIGEEDFT